MIYVMQWNYHWVTLKENFHAIRNNQNQHEDIMLLGKKKKKQNLMLSNNTNKTRNTSISTKYNRFRFIFFHCSFIYLPKDTKDVRAVDG